MYSGVFPPNPVFFHILIPHLSICEAINPQLGNFIIPFEIFNSQSLDVIPATAMMIRMQVSLIIKSDNYSEITSTSRFSHPGAYCEG